MLVCTTLRSTRAKAASGADGDKGGVVAVGWAAAGASRPGGSQHVDGVKKIPDRSSENLCDQDHLRR
jgi:hypothetical protein